MCRVSSRWVGSTRARSAAALCGTDPVIYLFAPRKHKQKRQARRYARVRLANDSAHIHATWIFGAGRRHSTATDSNPPYPKTDLRTISARDTCDDFASRVTYRDRAARLFAVAHSDEPQTTRNFQSKRSYKRRSRLCGCTYWGIAIFRF